MATVYQFKLSDSAEKFKIKVFRAIKELNNEEVLVEHEVSFREVEKAMIGSLVDLAIAQQKDPKKVLLGIDLKEIVENIQDNQSTFEFYDADRELLEKGIELSVGHRPMVWFKCRELWRQLSAWPEKQKDSEGGAKT